MRIKDASANKRVMHFDLEHYMIFGKGTILYRHYHKTLGPMVRVRWDNQNHESSHYAMNLIEIKEKHIAIVDDKYTIDNEVVTREEYLRRVLKGK